MFPLTGRPTSKTLGSFHRGALPLQSSHHLRRPDLPAGSDFPRVSTPFIGIHAPAPMLERVVRDPLRAPPSGFLNPSAVYASARSTALFRAAAGPGLSSVEPSPRRDRAPLSRPLAALRFLLRVPSAAAAALSPPVSPHARAPDALRQPFDARWRGSPGDYGLPFRRPKPTSRSPWVTVAEIALTAASALFAALLPLRVRSRREGLPPPAGRCSRGRASPEFTAFASEPRTHLTRAPGACRSKPSEPEPDTRSRPEGPSARRGGYVVPEGRRPTDRARPRAKDHARPTRRTPTCLIPRTPRESELSRAEHEDVGPCRLSTATPAPSTFANPRGRLR